MRKAEELTQEELVEVFVNHEELDIDDNRLTTEELVKLHERLLAAAIYVRDYRYDEFMANHKPRKVVIDDNEEMTVSLIKFVK